VEILSATWDQLRALREDGLQPAMKLIVTTNSRHAYRMDDIGVMAIHHRKGEPMPVELLQGLDVLLLLDDCEQATAVLRLCRAKGVTLASFRAWCKCAQETTALVMPCADAREMWNWPGDRAA
jgi:hypothetical protein